MFTREYHYDFGPYDPYWEAPAFSPTRNGILAALPDRTVAKNFDYYEGDWGDESYAPGEGLDYFGLADPLAEFEAELEEDTYN